MKVLVLPNLSYWFSAVPIKILANYLRILTYWHDIYIEKQKTHNTKREESWKTDIAWILWFNIKLWQSRQCNIGRRTEKWKTSESLQRNPHHYNQRISDRGTKAIRQSKDSHFQQMELEQLDIHKQRNECRHRAYTLHKVTSNGSVLNVKLKAIKLLKDSTGESLDNLRYDGDFSDAIPETWSMRE